MATAIEFENIGKQYRLGLVSTQTLSHDLNRWWQTAVLRREDPYLRIGETNDRSVKGSSDYVWALRDINFKVEQGDVVGIIGRNGAGKSTLLKLLSKVTAPTTGVIHARGRIGSLLEVGTGFHPEMTGRENIFMNGAILGMTKSEINRKLDEIVDFSGCERYLDTPVKRYSSGMMVRLGFAVAAHLDPEILVVDEVLAVGDAEFQKKAIGKMKDVSTSEGRTVLFVSHNMAAVRNLCQNGLVLSNGMISNIGTADECVDYYLSSANDFKTDTHVEITDEMHDKNRSMLATLDMAEFVRDKAVYASDEEIVIRVRIKSKRNFNQLRVNIGIMDVQEVSVGSYSSDAYFAISSGESKLLEYRIQPTNLAMGTYSLAFSVGMGNAKEGETNLDVLHHVLSFEIDKISCKDNTYFARWDRSWGNIRFNAELREL